MIDLFSCSWAHELDFIKALSQCDLFFQLSFQEWTQQVQDMLNTKKFGDIAFRDKDFKNAIEYYSKVHALSLSFNRILS